MKTRTIRGIQTGSAALAAVLVGLGTASCTAKETKPADAGTAASVVITVDATDTECALSATTAATGASTFVITNNGTKATEFYVYGEGGRVLAEVENVSPAWNANWSSSSAGPVPTRRPVSPAWSATASGPISR